MGRAPRFRPSRIGRPALPPRRAPAPARRARPPRPSAAHAPDHARARTPHGRHAPASTPRGTAGLPRAPPVAPTSAELRLPPLLHLICFLPSASASSSRSARLRHRPHQQLTGVGRSGCSSSPEPSLSCPKHRLLLAHLVLASISHEKLPFPGNPSPESWPSSPNSKIRLNEKGIENNLKISFFTLNGPRASLSAQPHRPTWPATAPRSSSRAPRPSAVHAPDHARARTPRGRHAPTSTPRGTVGLPRAPPVAPTSAELRLPPLLHLICFLPSASASSSRSARLRQRPHQQLAGVGRSDCSSSPEPSLSCPEHHLLLAHLVLASVSHEKLPFPGNPSPESWLSSPKCSAPWTSPLHPPSRSPRAQAPHELGEAPTPHLTPLLGRRWLAVGEPHHRVAMAAGQLALELLRPCRLHYRVHLGKVVTLVVTSSPATSPTASSCRSAQPPLPQGLVGGAWLTRGDHCQP
ncbi:uncharacterized protein [Miscanthus floridulus]|uniref:uncharacterized protein n=1 Tax=Miscanthus floridulus TaxID=154761 RepID=UPI0034583FC3